MDNNLLTTKNVLISVVVVSVLGLLFFQWGAVTTLLGIILGFAGRWLLEVLGVLKHNE